MDKPNQESAAPKKEPKAAPVAPKAPSNVEFIGEGAEKIKFTADPKAKLIRVYANGIVTSYL